MLPVHSLAQPDAYERAYMATPGVVHHERAAMSPVARTSATSSCISDGSAGRCRSRRSATLSSWNTACAAPIPRVRRCSRRRCSVLAAASRSSTRQTGTNAPSRCCPAIRSDLHRCLGQGDSVRVPPCSLSCCQRLRACQQAFDLGLDLGLAIVVAREIAELLALCCEGDQAMPRSLPPVLFDGLAPLVAIDLQHAYGDLSVVLFAKLANCGFYLLAKRSTSAEDIVAHLRQDLRGRGCGLYLVLGGCLWGLAPC